MSETTGYVPSTDRNLVAERRARLDAADRMAAERAQGRGKIRGRKTGDPRLDRARSDARTAALESRAARA